MKDKFKYVKHKCLNFSLLIDLSLYDIKWNLYQTLVNLQIPQ